MPRVRLIWPPPHECEHAVHGLQAFTVQSTGHAKALHVWLLLRAGHALPPCAAAVVTTRVADCKPEPHVSEHESQLLQGPTTQSTAQCFTKQLFTWDSSVGQS